MTNPRILVVQFGAGDGARLDSWTRHASRVTGEARVEPDEGALPTGFVWHLAAANYRALARSARVFDTVDDALRSADEVVAGQERLVGRMVRQELASQYGWYALLDDEPALTCARWYGMERDRRESMRLAISALARSVPERSARVVGSGAPGPVS